MRLHGRRRQCPFHGRKRQSPEGRVGFTWSRRCHPAWGSAQRGRSEVLIGNPTSKVNTIMTSHAVENPLWSRTLNRLVDQDPLQHGAVSSQWSCRELATVFARETGVQLSRESVRSVLKKRPKLLPPHRAPGSCPRCPRVCLDRPRDARISSPSG